MEERGRGSRTIWLGEDDRVRTIDQLLLPFERRIAVLESSEDCVRAIRDMLVRGAGLIGATAGFGLFLAAKEAPASEWRPYLEARAAALAATRPTAKNLEWALRRVLRASTRACARASELSGDGAAAHNASLALSHNALVDAARAEALAIADSDAEACRRIGEHGLPLIRAIYERSGRPVNLLTHCNAGALAFVDHGSATAPIYAAHEAGIPVHVWVDETRPRNQGASLTAWELGERGVPHTLICDNAGGHLMQHGMVDLAIVGADRVTRRGDAANKIGTYLKALAARDNGLPFYVALPSSTFDFSIADGIAEIPIEERGEDELRYVEGLAEGAAEGVAGSRRTRVLICPSSTRASNYGFDVTPARLITGLITERGVCDASEEGIGRLFPEMLRTIG